MTSNMDNNVKWLGWLHGLINKLASLVKIISLVNDEAWPVLKNFMSCKVVSLVKHPVCWN